MLAARLSLSIYYVVARIQGKHIGFLLVTPLSLSNTSPIASDAFNFVFQERWAPSRKNGRAP